MGQAFALLVAAIIIAGGFFLAAPHYQIAMGENQTLVWRLNTFSGELAVCTSPDMPGAGCRIVPEPKAPQAATPQGTPAPK